MSFFCKDGFILDCIRKLSHGLQTSRKQNVKKFLILVLNSLNLVFICSFINRSVERPKRNPINECIRENCVNAIEDRDGKKLHKQPMLKSFLETQLITVLLKLTAKMRLGRVLLFIVVTYQTKENWRGGASGVLSSALWVWSVAS